MSSKPFRKQLRTVTITAALLLALAGSATGSTPPVHHPTKPAAPHSSTTSAPVHAVLPAVDPRFPMPLRKALESDRFVVVGFYNPLDKVDSLTLAEARAGALAAHAGFVQVNLLDDTAAGPLTALLPSGQLLPNPGFIIYRRPGVLVYRSDGYLDRAAVAQAVKDAR